MAVASILPGGYVPDVVSLTIIFMAVLMAMAIASAVLVDTYRNRFSMPGIDAGSSRDIAGGTINVVKRGGLPDSARATLEVRRSTQEKGVFRGRKASKEGRVERMRHPLSPRMASDIKPWKLAVSFAATVSLGAVAYVFGEPSLGPETVLIVASLVVFFLGAVLLAGGFRSLRIYHLVRETPTTDAADVSPGDKVELYGRAAPSDQGTHKAPFSDEECLLCEYEIVEKPGEDEVVDSGTAGVLFYVDDGTGKVLVDPDGVEMRMELDTQVEVKSKRPPPEITGGYVEVGVNRVRTEYRERYLKPGENVYVYGDAVHSEQHDVVIGRRKKNSVSLITDSSEGELRRSLLSKAAARGATGTFLMSVGLAVALRSSGVPTL